MNLQQQLEAGGLLHQAGRLGEAEAIYRGILALDANHFGALFLLGTLSVQTGKPDVAIDLLRRAIELNPNYAEAHYNLGSVLQARGQNDEAIVAFRRAIVIKPAFPDTHNNLGIAFNEMGRLDEAIACYREAIRLRPEYVEAHYNLGIPLQKKGEVDAAIASYRFALKLKPDHALAHSNLGNALAEQGRFNEAIASYRQAIGFKPDYAPAHYNLGNALQNQGQWDEAISAYQQAITCQPDYPEAFNNLGNALKATGQLDEALAAFRQAMSLKPDFVEAHDNLLMTILYHPDFDQRMIRTELDYWNEQHATPARKLISPHTNRRDAERRLRIGYVSGDFGLHVVGRNLLPLFRKHDHKKFEIFCYSNIPRPDGLTRQFRQLADAWRDITKFADSQAADLIRRDEIDILVDLSLHTAGNRLGVFARKAAPVQVTSAGYPGSTGSETIDYRLTDPHLDPVATDDSIYSEKSVRLQNSFWCYEALVDEIEINAPPAESRGFATFGCLNNFCKINVQVLQLWARVLRAVSDSHLLLMAPEGNSRKRISERLAAEGIEADRIEFAPKQSRVEYLRSYNRIDIGLDTFPYNGHTTSLDALWMGVPVITLVGRTVVGRAGFSQLTNLNLRECIASTPEEYVRIAAAMAGDISQLAGLRRALRGRMQASPLMDAAGFARNIEAAYRSMWRNWVSAV